MIHRSPCRFLHPVLLGLHFSALLLGWPLVGDARDSAITPRASVDLSGSWKFCPAFEELEVNHAFLQKPLGVDRTYKEEDPDRHYGWIEPSFDDSKWWDIQVPGSWNTQFEDLWSYEGQGWYRKEIEIPAEWEGKRVVFHSDGANYRTVVYVNGHRVGIHEGGYVSFSLPIEDSLRFGQANTLAISVDNKSLIERVPMERHDWWVHGGLYRPVSLEVTNRLFVDDVDVVTHIDSGSASIEASISLSSLDESIQPVTLSVTLLAGGLEVAQASKFVTARQGALLIPVSLIVPRPRLWSPEDPFLHSLRVEVVREGEGNPSDVWSQRVGLRTLRIDGSRLLLNGEPFLVKGVNRYENYPETGMTSTADSLEQDLDLIQALGANTLRCHYPYAPDTYDRLDEEGLFAVCEIPLYQWGRPGHSEKNLEAAKAQLTEMIETLRDHPSVLMWSVSNENRTRPREEGEEHQRLSEMVVRGNLELIDLAHSLDPTRPVIAPSNRWPEDPLFAKTDLLSVNVYLGAETPHVESLPKMMETLQEQFQALRELHPDKPILVTEYGSWALRGLATDYFPGEIYQAELLSAYWNNFIRESHFVGGIIWVFADSDVHRKFTTIYEMRCAYGLYDFHRNPKKSVEVVRQQWRE